MQLGRTCIQIFLIPEDKLEKRFLQRPALISMLSATLRYFFSGWVTHFLFRYKVDFWVVFSNNDNFSRCKNHKAFCESFLWELCTHSLSTLHLLCIKQRIIKCVGIQLIGNLDPFSYLLTEVIDCLSSTFLCTVQPINTYFSLGFFLVK